ncbi:MAG: preprotein translocase subunit SecE [Cyanobacteriota bacterium]|nr:preprotein translocase subunit SecE [Cyanobacteriota bacterium]
MAKKNEAELKENGDGFELAKFFQGTQEELTKVVWPSRQQVISESAAVLLMVSLLAFMIYFIDKLFNWASIQVFG